MSERQAVLGTLEEYASAYCAKDTPRLMALFDDGEDISLIGTGADELCSGRDEVRGVFDRNFAEATATQFDWGWQHVIVEGGFAVIATTLTIHIDAGGTQMVVPIRWTIALVRRANGWRWLHRNASVAAQSQDSGTAYPDGK